MRVAVRDTSSERLGAAMQYVEVPDLTKNRLTLSGVVVSGIEANKPTGSSDSNPQSGPALRLLRQGMLLDYRYNIYNAQADASGKPQIETRMRLFRDGQNVFTGKPQTLDVSQQKNMKRLMGAGRIRLGPELIQVSTCWKSLSLTHWPSRQSVRPRNGLTLRSGSESSLASGPEIFGEPTGWYSVL